MALYSYIHEKHSFFVGFKKQMDIKLGMEQFKREMWRVIEVNEGKYDHISLYRNRKLSKIKKSCN